VIFGACKTKGTRNLRSHAQLHTLTQARCRYNTVREGYRVGTGDPFAQLPSDAATVRSHYRGFKETDNDFLSMTPEVLGTEFATLNTAKFRPARSQQYLTTDDSAIKGWSLSHSFSLSFPLSLSISLSL
jgi:hypothetical protein